jgi:myosin-5
MPAIQCQSGLVEPRQGTQVWFKLGELWQLGTVTGVSGNQINVQDSDGKTASVTPDGAFLCAGSSNGSGVSDMISLGILTEVSVIDNLHTRFMADEIYSSVGPILIAVNPYKDLGVYGTNMVEQSNDPDAPPHIYQIANNCYKALTVTGTPQSVLVSGESGSGKTESTKFILRYLAEASKSQPGAGHGVQERVLKTNPLLEAFGNARTVRNNNSSRFGKYITLEFNPGGGMVGAFISVYLLEKSRVVSHNTGERTYHVFYQMMKGLSSSEKSQLGLSQLAEPKYMTPPGGSWRNEVEEMDGELHLLKESMHSIGLSSASDQSQIFAVLAAVLCLGEAQFEGTSDYCSPSSASSNWIQEVAKLLGVNAEGVTKVLTHRTLRVGTDLIAKQLGADKALGARDAMAKALYDALFSWLVSTTNRALLITSTAKSELAMAATGRSIAVLDIFGFENFDHNSFEQLNINYANERLQSLFCKHMFKAEQAEYQKENIPWRMVDAPDNSDVVKLLQDKRALLALLDEETTYPKGTDSTLLNKLNSNLKSRLFSKPTGKRASASANGLCFAIEHFAGKVEYVVTGFLEKNRDDLGLDAQELLQQSTKPIIAQMFVSAQETGGDDDDEEYGSAAARKRKIGSKGTVVSKFKTDLAKLCATLERSSLHFVRCIKPNSRKVGGVFDPMLVLPQLRCSGIVETVKIRKAGYAVRLTYASFVAAFSVLLPKSEGGTAPPQTLANVDMAQVEELIKLGEEMGQSRGDPRQLTDKILAQAASKQPNLGKDENGQAPWVFGGTKVSVPCAGGKGAFAALKLCVCLFVRCSCAVRR